MDKLTREARQWLDYRYRVGLAEGRYRSHEPIFGIGQGNAEPHQVVRLARTHSIFRHLAQMQFDTLLDVGGSEGFHASLAGRLFGAKVVTSDLSSEASRRAQEFYGLPALASDAHWLPFANESFDVVLCCEVLEHVSNPVVVMSEVLRVTRRYALFSTEQVAHSSREREILLFLPGQDPHPHAERHWFLPADFEIVLGRPLFSERQSVLTQRCGELLTSGQEEPPEGIRDLLLEMTSPDPTPGQEHGLLVVKIKSDKPPLHTPSLDNEALVDAILAHRLPLDQESLETPSILARFLLEKLACPICLLPLTSATEQLTCSQCHRKFPIQDRLPLLHLDPLPADREIVRENRWPWLTEEARSLRSFFTSPRPKLDRLLAHLLNLELGLLECCNKLAAPQGDYLNSEAVSRALATPSAGPTAPPELPQAPKQWWDELPASGIEIPALQALGMNLLKLKTRADELTLKNVELTEHCDYLSTQLHRIYSRWQVKAYLWLKRILTSRLRGRRDKA